MESTLAERAKAVEALVAAGDVKPLADELVTLTELTGGRWTGDAGAAVNAVRRADDALRVDVAVELLGRYFYHDALGHQVAHLAGMLTQQLSDGPIELAEALVAVAARHDSYYPAEQLRRQTEILLAAGRQIAPEVVAVMRRMVDTGYYGANSLGDVLAKLPGSPLNVGEAWSDAALADLPQLGDDWVALFAHARTATSAKPSAKWDKRAGELLDAIGRPAARDRLLSWLGLVGRARTFTLRRGLYGAESNELFDSYNVTALRGLVWALSLLEPSPDTARVLGAVVETSLRKVAGVGPRSPKMANAAVFALSRMDGDAALAQIARLAARVTFKGTLKELNAALDRRATTLGLTRDEVEELAVPTYGLTAVGHRLGSFGDASAELTIHNGELMVTWRNDAGKTVKSVPAAVKTGHAEAVKELKAAVKDIEKMLTAQAERLDRQFLAQRVWRYGQWRERYLDHPLLGTLARRLLWTVDGTPCCYADGELRGLNDTVITAAPTSEVTLWHPIGWPVETVLAWRAWLERHGVTQPFKQAHREVYLLTAAEENTRVYSNRFAAHILRQHQFHALAAVRGWRNRLRLMVDDTYPPATRDLPQWGLRAEFWIEGIGDDDGTDTLDSGAYLRVATDQVRFYPIAAPENYAHASGGGYEQWVHQNADPTAPVPLDQVPPLVLSEVLRDVDLFVGVASVGNDPTWQDGGPEGRFREYWASYSFGDLSATAQTRRDLLTRLIPRLSIADRATVDGRFLKVRGDLRTYKIHLGSGNILMEPNDEYLCIVPKQSTDSGTGGLFLPFEGDRVLAVILSKAMLLAKDATITDPTITHQLRR